MTFVICIVAVFPDCDSESENSMQMLRVLDNFVLEIEEEDAK
jgi:hypothetical protein